MVGTEARRLDAASAEPVGVWRVYQTHEDLAACSGTVSPGRGRAKPRLSAALIVRNEQRKLRSCLESVAGVVDEIVVVDTGSTDRTTDVARVFGARVFDFPWTDDFGAARAESYRRATGDWVLQIDADETMHPYAREQIDPLLADESKGAYFVLLRRRSRLTRNWQIKLYRRRVGVESHGVIHESVPPHRVRELTDLALGMYPLQFEHSGYDGDMLDRHHRNLPLLLERLKGGPDHAMTAAIWGHLADVFEGLDRDKLAESAREHSVAVARKKDKPHPGDSALYLRLLTARLVRGQEAAGLLAETASLFPDNLQLLWIEGHCLMGQERYREAVERFEQIIQRGQAGKYHRWVAYDRRLFGGLSQRAIALCRQKLS